MPTSASSQLSARHTKLVGKPLSPADVKTVFLNLEQLAAVADDLAAGFEKAMGEDTIGPGATARQGEGGTDTLGQVFTSLVSSYLNTLTSDPSFTICIRLLLCSAKSSEHAVDGVAD
jgi:hypothetical protein